MLVTPACTVLRSPGQARICLPLKRLTRSMPSIALFRNVVPGKAPQEENPWKKSVLDLVMEDAKRLNKHLGASDQNKMSEYLESVRSIENRIQSQDKLKDFEANINRRDEERIG